MRKAKTTKRDQKILDQWIEGFKQERKDNLHTLEANINSFFNSSSPWTKACKKFCLGVMDQAYNLGRESISSKF